MNALVDIKENFQYEVLAIKDGFLTVIKNSEGISQQTQIRDGNNSTIVAGHIYSKSGLNVLVYFNISEDGKIVQALKEEEGVLPNLFYDQNQNVWALLTDTTSDNDLEIALPLMDRGNLIRPKGKKQFPGYYIGTINQFIMFHDFDTYFSKTPDKILRLELKANQIKDNKQFKIPLPLKNKLFIENENNIHLLSRQGDKLVHRIMDLNCSIKNEKQFTFLKFNSFEILELSFNSTSKIIYTIENSIYLGIIDQNGVIESKKIFTNDTEIFNIWKPTKICDDIFILRFNFETGNGWIVFQGDKILECYKHDKINGYKNILTDEVISIPQSDLILSDITKVGADSYCVSVYPRNEKNKSDKLYILNKKINGR